jgi:hypothetical protein
MDLTNQVKAIKALADEVRVLDIEKKYTSLIEDIGYIDMTDDEEYNTTFHALEEAKRLLKKKSAN